MNNKYFVSMYLTGLDLLVLSTLIEHIRLGDDNMFETSISNLATDLEDADAFDLIEEARQEYGTPELIVTSSMNDGIVLSFVK